MKFNRLLGKVLNSRSEEDKPEAQRPARPARKLLKKPAAPAASTEDQWLKVLEEAEPEHNPYDTYSWELNPGTEERRLKRKEFKGVEKPKPDPSGGVNPYDTGVFRGGGWDG